MIFARRALQRRITELRTLLPQEVVDKLAVRLNRHGKDRLAAMWEVVVLHALSRQGEITSEVPLSSGRRPDLTFTSIPLRFTADVTIVSDDGLDDQNPYQELSARLERLKSRLGLAVGGSDIRVASRIEATSRGERRVLRLPERRALDAFLRERIEPDLREQIAQGHRILRVSINDEVAGVDIVIDPGKSPYSSGSYAAYDVPTIKDRNPLYNALKAKARQLRGAEGITGIIVGDGDSTALSERQSSGLNARAIAREFLRQHRSIDFLFILSVREKQRSYLDFGPLKRWVHGLLEIGPDSQAGPELEQLFSQAMTNLPQAVAMPVNGALRAQEPGYGWGHHGGHRMSNSRIKISSRELMELLAGRRTVEQLNESHGWRGVNTRSDSRTMFNPFDKSLSEGRLPAQITVVPTGEDDSDDWIEFEIGAPDPSISPIE